MTSSATFNVALDFTQYLGGRYETDGPGSGEALRKRIVNLLQNHEHVVVDLTGVRGCPSSCLEEAFGGLVRHATEYDINPSDLLGRVTVRSNDIVSNSGEARDYLIEAVQRASRIKSDDDPVPSASR